MMLFVDDYEFSLKLKLIVIAHSKPRDCGSWNNNYLLHALLYIDNHSGVPPPGVEAKARHTKTICVS
jgi:hypothetical protein